MTTTQQLGISVLSAPLAAIDRRSLSQAWYSALHLARDAAPASDRPAQRRPAVSGAGIVPVPPRDGSSRPSNVSTLRPAAGSCAPVRADGSLERRAARSPLARHIERAIAGRPPYAWRAAIGVGTDGTRVLLLLRGSRERLVLVAVCAPASRAAVVRALEQARFALAARGIVLNARVTGAPQCS
jgi:hypothetical protein